MDGILILLGLYLLFRVLAKKGRSAMNAAKQKLDADPEEIPEVTVVSPSFQKYPAIPVATEQKRSVEAKAGTTCLCVAYPTTGENAATGYDDIAACGCHTRRLFGQPEHGGERRHSLAGGHGHTAGRGIAGGHNRIAGQAFAGRDRYPRTLGGVGAKRFAAQPGGCCAGCG